MITDAISPALLAPTEAAHPTYPQLRGGTNRLRNRPAAGCVIHVTQTYAYLLNETTSRRQWQLRLYPKGKKQRDLPICHELAILLACHTNGKSPGQPLFQGSGGGYIDYANQRNNAGPKRSHVVRPSR
jgi:hypothetical protein